MRSRRNLPTQSARSFQAHCGRQEVERLHEAPFDTNRLQMICRPARDGCGLHCAYLIVVINV